MDTTTQHLPPSLPPEPPRLPPRLSGLHILGIVAAAMVAGMLATLLVVKIWLFPAPFKPVQLSAAEEQRLERKLSLFDQAGRDEQPVSLPPGPRETASPHGAPLEPEAYSEAGASREITLSEREINAMIAKNTDLADKIAIDLAKDLVSLKMLIPVDPDFPFLGGKILKARTGVELAFRQGRPVCILRGVSVMGVPIPNAWMGGLKNIDLMEVFGGEQGFWQAVGDGVAAMEIEEGRLRIVLKE